MDYKDFEKLKERFSRANTDEKVSLYVNPCFIPLSTRQSFE